MPRVSLMIFGLLLVVGLVSTADETAVRPDPLAENFHKQVRPFLGTYCLSVTGRRSRRAIST